MPKFGCRCGHVLNLSRVPNPVEYLFVSTELLSELEDERGKESAAVIIDEIFRSSLELMRCPECERIWVGQGRDTGRFDSYVPEAKVLSGALSIPDTGVGAVSGAAPDADSDA